MSEKHGNPASAYATHDDFCRIFTQETNQLYLLAFLLTGEQEQAEKCFARAIDDCLEGTVVFREWAPSWVRRMVIKSALRQIPLDGKEARHDVSPEAMPGLDLLLPVIRLPRFERFVFVMSVLEKYSTRESAMLLNSTPREIVKSRARAVQRIALGHVAPLLMPAKRSAIEFAEMLSLLGKPEVKTA